MLAGPGVRGWLGKMVPKVFTGKEVRVVGRGCRKGVPGSVPLRKPQADPRDPPSALGKERSLSANASFSLRAPLSLKHTLVLNLFCQK